MEKKIIIYEQFILIEEDLTYFIHRRDLDPHPDSQLEKNAGSGSALNQCGSATLTSRQKNSHLIIIWLCIATADGS